MMAILKLWKNSSVIGYKQFLTQYHNCAKKASYDGYLRQISGMTWNNKCDNNMSKLNVSGLRQELVECFNKACVSEPVESAEYIVAHALGHKTVRLFGNIYYCYFKLYILRV